MADKNILLIEPGYKNKYPPLGLMKIAQYHGPRGKRDRVRLIKGEDPSVLNASWDRVYITTLFSFEYQRIAHSIDFALVVTNGQADKIFVGGIAASLMHDRFLSETRWSGVRFISGLLDKPPAMALQLDDFSEELYSDDTVGEPIEDLTPDYSILDQIEYRYPVRDAYFAYASRGCIRSCSFCGVPKLEGPQRDARPLSWVVKDIDRLYGKKRDLILMDNNVVASPRFRDIIAEIRDLGFTPGAKLQRAHERVPAQRRVDFNQGVDARILAKDKTYLKELASICLRPLRIAFDHLGLRKPYEQSVRYARDAGLSELSNYMLYNFHDSPADLFERMRLNVALNEELGIRIWSFPMRYQPTNLPERSHVGPRWTRYELRSLQIVLQATHGVVSGAPDFFKRAFGDTVEQFEGLVLYPHRFIFHRDWFEKYGGRAELDEYRGLSARLSNQEKAELLTLLSSCDPRDFGRLKSEAANARVKEILHFYAPISKEAEAGILKRRRLLSVSERHGPQPPEEIRIEDAGLEADDFGNETTGIDAA